MKKRKEAKKEEKKEEKIPDGKNCQDKQLKTILIVMALIILFGAAVYFLIDNSKTFHYGGISFRKIMFDKLPLYYSRLPVLNSGGEKVANYNLYLRYDPRNLSEITVNGTLEFLNYVRVSIDPDVESRCSDSAIAGASLGTFLQASGVRYDFAYTNETYALEQKKPYATCQVNQGPGITYIVIQDENENQIRQETDNCYVVAFKECDIMKVIERLIVSKLAQSNGEVV